MLLVGYADIARRANWNVQFAVGSKCNKFPAMMEFMWQLISNHDGLGGIRQIRFDVVVTKDARDFRSVQRTVFERDPTRYIKTPCDGENLAVDDGINVTRFQRTDKYGAIGAQCHLSRVWNIGSINADAESCGSLIF